MSTNRKDINPGWPASFAGMLVGWACIKGAWLIFHPPAPRGLYDQGFRVSFFPLVQNYSDLWFSLGVGAAIAILILLFGRTNASRKSATVTLLVVAGAAIVFGMVELFSIEEVNVPGS